MNTYIVAPSKAHMIAALPRNRRVGGSNLPLPRRFDEMEVYKEGFWTGALLGVMGLGVFLTVLLCS